MKNIKQPTIKETLAAINALPGIRGKYVSEYREFQIRARSMPAATYFTEDRGDALMTAVVMSKQMDN